jgi:Xaa-Pro aminopeptidase
MPILDSFNAPTRSLDGTALLSAEHIEGFRRSQALAYACVEAVERELREGMTEREVAARMETYLADHGVRQYFHRPFAWFGERTALRGMKTALGFMPSSRRLEAGMPVILDVAPVLDGYASDIAYACKLGPDALHDQMLSDLAPYRTLILEGVRAGRHLTAIYRDVDRLIEEQGYENRHRRYPFGVLAHRVNFTPPAARSARSLLRFGLPALGFLLPQILTAHTHPEQATSPLWNARASSDHPATPGLWAVEPHLALRGVGVKWEELLVVTENDAYWLDDDLPHVRRFRALA